MKVTFPHLGPVLAYKKMFELFGHEVVMPSPPTQSTLELGVKYSPEFICLPFKVILGSYLEAITRGAELVVTSGGIGACRAGYFGDLSEKILRQLGYNTRVLVFDSFIKEFPEFYRQAREVRNHCSLIRALSILNLTFHLIYALDQYEKKINQLRPYEVVRGASNRKWLEIQKLIGASNSLNELKINIKEAERIISEIAVAPRNDLIQVGLVGEIYMVMESAINQEIENKLADMGVAVTRYRNISHWLKYCIRPNFPILKKADRYLHYELGGHERENIGYMIQYKELGYDGIIHLLPFGCMPELVTQTIIPQLSKDLDIPILSLSLDEQSGWLNNQVRLEAFVDLLKNRRELLSNSN
ncbi:MAG TPA: hypothetical protein DDW65_13230 [Firmicutes bacterium]|nr:hypothetical protein [Bacillota bacterium]